MATIFDALRTQIGTLSAVTALVGSRIRPLRLPSKDDIRVGGALLIDPLKEENQLDLNDDGGAQLLRLRFRAVAATLSGAYAIAQALYFNGTNPASGLNGFDGTVQGIPIQVITLIHKEFAFEWFQDGSDEGYYAVDWHGEVAYSEPL
jgi:hypothetical protein